MGESSGHEFRGNQYGSVGGENRSDARGRQSSPMVGPRPPIGLHPGHAAMDAARSGHYTATATGMMDRPGASAGMKDHARIADIKTRAGGDRGKEVQLARQMANSITSADKATRRGRAADEAGATHLGSVFHARARQLK